MRVFVAGASGAVERPLVRRLIAVGNEVTALARWEAGAERVRTRGTDNLLAGTRAAGVRRLIAQSYGSWTDERSGAGRKTEEDPLDPTPPKNQRQTLAAIHHLELPAWVAAMVVGEVGVSMVTRVRGASNAKAKRVLGWTLERATWRPDFGLSSSPSPSPARSQPVR